MKQSNQLFARILLHKRIRSSPFTNVIWRDNLEKISKFKIKWLRPVIYGNKKHGICNYCHMIGRKLTKEHLVPKYIGGREVLIGVCWNCNQKRGTSPSYPSFIKFIKDNPEVWREAKRRAWPADAREYHEFLSKVKEALNKT